MCCWWSFCADPQLLHVPVWYVGSWCTVGRVQAHSLSIFGANASVFYRCMTAGANGLMRLLGMKLPSPGWCVHLHGVAVVKLCLKRKFWNDFHSLSWKGEGHPKMSVCDALFVSLQCLCVRLALHLADGSLLGLCVFKPHLCHQASVLQDAVQLCRKVL